MADLPRHVMRHEEGPREGFRIEPGPVSASGNLRSVEACAAAGIRHGQVCSCASARVVLVRAKAGAVFAGPQTRAGLAPSAPWFNAAGLACVLAFRETLTLSGSVLLTASDVLASREVLRSHPENLAPMRATAHRSIKAGLYVGRIGVMTTLNCDYQDDISPARSFCAGMGMAAGADLGALIEAGRLPEATMGRSLPSEPLGAGSLDAFRQAA